MQHINDTLEQVMVNAEKHAPRVVVTKITPTGINTVLTVAYTGVIPPVFTGFNDNYLKSVTPIGFDRRHGWLYVLEGQTANEAYKARCKSTGIRPPYARATLAEIVTAFEKLCAI
ncbi:MAG: hypothetical protein IPN33_25715 [Saprospiraceae bacterium]|nr:hypothetical protein [Saprospiraceae bacterium]